MALACRAQDHLPPNTFLAGDETRHGVAHKGGVDHLLVDPGVRDRDLDRFAAQRLQARIHMLAEAGHAHAGHDCS
jgi:hypothetical protein